MPHRRLLAPRPTRTALPMPALPAPALPAPVQQGPVGDSPPAFVSARRAVLRQ